MTTTRQEQRKCLMCGNVSAHNIIQSNSAFGSPQLDTRPPAPEGWSIEFWVQRCPSCGYCAGDISEGKPELVRTVKCHHYRKQLQSPDFPELANTFLCSSLLKEEAGEYAVAGFACIHAAWACDDVDRDTAAQECRKKAVAFLQKAREKGQRYARQIGLEELLIADLLRRSRQFEDALSICEEGLRRDPDKLISNILNFQIMLIKRSDSSAHTVAESPNISEAIPPVKEDPRSTKYVWDPKKQLWVEVVKKDGLEAPKRHQ